MATTREELLAPARVSSKFASSVNAKSATLDSATSQFQIHSGDLLGEIVRDSAETIKTALTELKKLDAAEVLKALGQIGQALPIIAEAGQVLRKGLEKLKRAIEALMEMFGKDAVKVRLFEKRLVKLIAYKVWVVDGIWPATKVREPYEVLESDFATDISAWLADLDDIASKAAQPGVRVIYVTHFVGFAQPIAEVRKIAQSHNLRLFEDCALALFELSPTAM